MGILDRKYGESDFDTGGYRPRFSFKLSVTMWIIIANAAVFLLAARGTPLGRWVYEQGHFATAWMGWPHLEVWRLITFQFLHADLTHIVFNMIGFYVFAPTVEQHLGRKRFLAFYLVCGICGGLAYLVLNALGYALAKAGIGPVPVLLFNDVRMPLVGASAGVFGVIMACAYIVPNERVIVFPIPFEVKIKTLAYAYFAIALIGLIFRGQNQGGEAAHVGGAIAGFFFVRNAHLLRDFFDVLDDSRKPKGGRKARASGGSLFGGMRAGGGMPEAELDRLLAKIKTSGFDSLSESEKRWLWEDTETRRRGASERGA
jgi:membrane associated rhomboid family serine protease